MSHEREPVRWAEPDSDCDPLLRRLIGSAREGLGDAALAQRIEQAVRAQTVAGSESEELMAEVASRNWRVWVGVAVLLVGVSGAVFGWRTTDARRRATVAVASDALDLGADSSPTQSPSDTNKAQSAGPVLSTSEHSAHPGTNTTRVQEALPASATDVTALRGRNLTTTLEDDARPPRRSSHLRPSRATASGKSVANTEPKPTSSAPRKDSTSAEPGGDASDSLVLQPNTFDSTHQGTSPPPNRRAVPPELSLISAAQRALRTTPQEALALTEQHARAYPHGRFAAEREEIAISALFALDRPNAGRARAQAFLVQNPQALAAPRLRRLLEDSR